MLRFRSPIVLVCALLPVALSPSSSQAAKAKEGKAKPIQKASFGKVDGKPVDLYTLTNAKGAVAKITNYGAIVTELHVPDRDGKMGDVVLGFDNVDDYVEEEPVLRRHRRPRREPDQGRDLRAGRQDVQAEREQQAPPPARRHRRAGTR